MAGKPMSAAPEDRENGFDHAGELIDAKIAALGDWRAAMLTSLRRLIRQADPAVGGKLAEAIQPFGRSCLVSCPHPVYGRDLQRQGKADLAQGAALPDPTGLFNASLDGGTRRAIDLRDGDAVNEVAFRSLVLAAIAFIVARH